MKTTLYFKYADIILQIIALGYPIVLCVQEHDASKLFWAYLSVGSVQYVSCFMNRMFLDGCFREDTRERYEVFLLIITIMAIISGIFITTSASNPHFGEFFGLIWVCLVALLFVSPFLAFWYGMITFHEIDIIRSYREPQTVD